MDLGLKKKRALVLGSSSGMGFAIAKTFHDEGARVAICGHEEKHLLEAAAEIPGCLSLIGDLDQRGTATRLVQETVKHLGGIDILVANTGGPPKGDFKDLSLDQWQLGFDRLFMSTVESIQAALPHMKKQKWGRILMSTSTAAKEPIPKLALSNGIRSGLLGLMKTIALEVAIDGVTVNALLPGYTRTKRLAELGFKEEEYVKDIPMRRAADPMEYAALAVFLASHQAGYITGQAIACDGGLLRGL